MRVVEPCSTGEERMEVAKRVMEEKEFRGTMEDEEEAMRHWGGVHGGGQEGRCFHGAC